MSKEELRKVKCRNYKVSGVKEGEYDFRHKPEHTLNGYFHEWGGEHIGGTNSAKTIAVVEIVETGEVIKFDPEDIKFVEEF